MAADIIWYLTMFGCAALFVGIGVYAKRLETPMWFWSGSQVDPNSITDVLQYNGENARMWFGYSLWFWISGVAWIWNKWVAVVILMLGSTVGIGLLIWTYLRPVKPQTGFSV